MASRQRRRFPLPPPCPYCSPPHSTHRIPPSHCRGLLDQCPKARKAMVALRETRQAHLPRTGTQRVVRAQLVDELGKSSVVSPGQRQMEAPIGQGVWAGPVKGIPAIGSSSAAEVNPLLSWAVSR